MRYQRKLKGLYVITDDTLTPEETLYMQVEDAIKGGATIVQLRDKKNSDEIVEKKAIHLQNLCKKHNVLFVLNDKIDLAIKLQCDGLHIGRSDHDNFIKIRENFDGIIGVSCYGDINKAKQFELLGADYVAFGSFYTSPTKPDSSVVSLDTIQLAKEKLEIPVCVIGGITTKNLDEIIHYKPDMISVISDIWKSSNIKQQAKIYTNTFKTKR